VDIKPSASLAGEQELSERKGEWKYEASSSDMPNGAASADAASAATVASVEETEDYDGDGVKEGTDEGSRPEALTAARDGGADNLKEIKGIGPALERLCNELGIYHFDQIAGWSADEVAWMNANLKGFKGRVSRDNWVEQAKILAAGGETEFSKRVEDGGVY
jgi:predicted flap endonuclease-1-like 5' DNA nuclease